MVMEYLKFVAIELIRPELHKASQENLGGIEVGTLLWDLSIFQLSKMRQYPYRLGHFDVSKNDKSELRSLKLATSQLT